MQAALHHGAHKLMTGDYRAIADAPIRSPVEAAVKVLAALEHFDVGGADATRLYLYANLSRLQWTLRRSISERKISWAIG